MNSICKTNKDGDKYWVIPNTEKDDLSYCGLGILHKENSPAIEQTTGHKEWYIKGILHRENGPAKEYSNGSKYWYINGLWHREDGPALEYDNGSKHWYINGKLHREDGPAKEWCNGNVDWFFNGKHIKPKIEMMSKYIQLNPDNILKRYRYPLKIQKLAISLKPSIIFSIPYPHEKLKELYPQLMALRDSGLI